MLRRRTLALSIVTLLALVLEGSPAASAAQPPRVGAVSCASTAHSTFWPWLDWAPGLLGRRINPRVDALWKLDATLIGCSGTQSGGNPKLPGPVDHGEVKIRARAVDHSCYQVSQYGLAVKSLRIKWYDAQGRKLGVTSARSGNVSWAGLGAGIPSWMTGIDLPPGVSPTVPPGIVTVSIATVGDARSSAFPGEAVSVTGPADQVIDDFPQLPCSYTYPPVNMGLGYFDFTGAHGPSTLSIGP
jgi:hypothetical protein